MGILLNGYDLKKGFGLKRNYNIEIRETALKNAYPIIGDSIKKTPTIFCDHSVKMTPAIFCDHSVKMTLLGPCITHSCQNKGQGSF